MNGKAFFRCRLPIADFRLPIADYLSQLAIGNCQSAMNLRSYRSVESNWFKLAFCVFTVNAVK